jgi:beta-lactam-binding protein with PASTA domain
MSITSTQVPAKKQGIRGTIWFNLLIMLGVCAILYLIFFSSLSVLTRHGDDRKVPKLAGMKIQDAMRILEEQDFDVRVDSTYMPDKPALIVLDQMPDIGDMVKHGRTIFLTVNKSVPPETSMPNLVNLSYRSALLILKSNRLVLGDTVRRPDAMSGAVLEMMFNGQTIRPGDMIPQGSKITLVIGDGFGNTILEMPDVIGMTYPEAVALLSGMQFQITPAMDADVVDSNTARVYRQDPSAISDLGTPYRIRQGDFVTLWVGQNPADSVMEENRNKWKDNLYNQPEENPQEPVVDPNR